MSNTISSGTSTGNLTSGLISSAGVGSGLDITSIVSQLMTIESQPLLRLQQKEASYQATLSSFGTLNSALNTFETAVSSLSSASQFQGLTATPSNSSVLSATATTKATPGTYNVNVTQLAQAQSILSAGQTSISTAIGSGASTTLSFQFGTINGGSLGLATASGNTLNASVASGGIAANSLSINGTTIITDGTTTSAKALADAITAQSGATNVTATAQAADTGAGSALTTALGAFTTLSSAGGSGTYDLSVGGVDILSSALGNDQAVGGIGTGAGGAIQADRKSVV